MAAKTAVPFGRPFGAFSLPAVGRFTPLTKATSSLARICGQASINSTVVSFGLPNKTGRARPVPLVETSFRCRDLGDYFAH
jgi:hypothetical protein